VLFLLNLEIAYNKTKEVDQREHGERLCKKTCQARKLNRGDAMYRSRWTKQIKDD